VREAAIFRRQVQKVFNEQRDLLSSEANENISGALDHLREALALRLGQKEIQDRMENLEKVANTWFMPYPHPAVRENVREILVALALILAITTFFLQLTKIPTGSLQPTLYGITYHPLPAGAEFQMPGRISRFFQYWIKGVSHFHVVAERDGTLQRIDAPKRLFPFIQKQNFWIEEQQHTIWFPTDELLSRAGVREGRFFRKGEDILKMKVISGDHLLVDRFTFNFRRPKRGEIIVFKTRGINDLPPGQLYIKRLVALGGEVVRIGNDQHLVINGERLDASTPRFENVYTFDPERLPENNYFGHVNGLIASRHGSHFMAPLFPNGEKEYRVPANHYLAMGDNTLNSLDSRAWGGVPQENVTGKSWFVYWPITERFGWGPR
jgi:signal peptidase I